MVGYFTSYRSSPYNEVAQPGLPSRKSYRAVLSSVEPTLDASLRERNCVISHSLVVNSIFMNDFRSMIGLPASAKSDLLILVSQIEFLRFCFPVSKVEKSDYA
jgi:hypothetical protein